MDIQLIRCNKCGKEIDEKKEDYLLVCKNWGYFSKKDMMSDRFVMCEDCYDYLIEGFQVDIIRVEQIEI